MSNLVAQLNEIQDAEAKAAEIVDKAIAKISALETENLRKIDALRKSMSSSISQTKAEVVEEIQDKAKQIKPDKKKMEEATKFAMTKLDGMFGGKK